MSDGRKFVDEICVTYVSEICVTYVSHLLARYVDGRKFVDEMCVTYVSHPHICHTCEWTKYVTHTGWQSLIGSPKLQIIFHKRATKYRSLLKKMTCKDKESYESSPPCITHVNGCHTCEWMRHVAHINESRRIYK